MLGARFAVVFGVALLVFVAVGALYLVWIRMIGLDPSLAQEYAKLSRPMRMLTAALFGGVLGAGIEVVPTLRAGIAGVVLFGASVFIGLMLFEIAGNRAEIRG